MSNKYRLLAPAMPSDEGANEEESAPENPVPKKMVGACDGCREYKRKCTRERPACKQCCMRRMECVYTSSPKDAQVAALQAKTERLESDLNTVIELHWYLRTQPKGDAVKVLEAIQAGVEPHEILDNIRVSPGSKPSHHAPNNSRLAEPGLASSSSLGDGSSGPQNLLEPLNIIAALENGVEAFFNCTGCIFHIYEREAAHELLKAARKCIEEANKAWPELIFGDSVSGHQKSSLCSVCIMAAVGLQYTKNPIPVMGFVSSAENGTFRYTSIFYDMARHLLEATIENNVLEAMKVCAALCVFNTISHATVALVYADMGLNFYLNHSSDTQSCPPGMSQVSWNRYKRVTRTLVTLRGWLITSLGYVHGDNPGLRRAIDQLTSQEASDPTEVIQQQLAKVVQIEASLLDSMDSFKDLSPLVFSSTRKDLAQWHQELPQWMWLDALTKPNDLPIGIIRTIFLVHLFYLSANILVARLAHSGANSPPSQYGIESMTAASDGVIAARTASRILQLQLEEQGIFQQCWLCIFTSYMSALVLIHSSAQLLVHDYPQSVWQMELSYAKSCIDVLEYCAQEDHVAHSFATNLRSYYHILIAQAEHSDAISASEVPDKFDYLFTIPTSSPQHLTHFCQEMLQLVSSPFGLPTNLHTEEILNSGLGSPLDWNIFVTLPFNRSAPVTSQKTLLEMALSMMKSGQFVGSSAPHGWNALVNHRKE